ncbi:MAG: DUF6143 family protein [Lachnospiraceae bacterium]|nr:DUF6143 family protein [Lachnospiraceae bacterium]
MSQYIIDSNKNIQSTEVVSIPVSLSKSIQGQYFVGQTKPIFVCDKKIAWAGLINPCNSGVNLFANIFTISNFSQDYLTAEIWLNTDFPEDADVSSLISPSNTALYQFPHNKVNIKSLNSTTVFPCNDVNIYKRIVPPNTTLVSEEDGKFIEPPGGNYTIVLKSSSSILDTIIIAFGWWEQSI